MSGKADEAAEEITFEDGYEELKRLVERIGRDDVGVDEKFECFRRAKGLEQTLRSHLSDRQGELEEIGQGKNLPEFRIVGHSGPAGLGAVAAREAGLQGAAQPAAAAAAGRADAGP